MACPTPTPPPLQLGLGRLSKRQDKRRMVCFGLPVFRLWDSLINGVLDLQTLQSKKFFSLLLYFGAQLVDGSHHLCVLLHQTSNHIFLCCHCESCGKNDSALSVCCIYIGRSLSWLVLGNEAVSNILSTNEIARFWHVRIMYKKNRNGRHFHFVHRRDHIGKKLDLRVSSSIEKFQSEYIWSRLLWRRRVVSCYWSVSCFCLTFLQKLFNLWPLSSYSKPNNVSYPLFH